MLRNFMGQSGTHLLTNKSNNGYEMPIILFKIPLVDWVRRTIKYMNTAGKEDSKNWSNYWLQAYEDLGGKSTSSGSKGCPKCAVYGLWRLGRISNSGRDFQNPKLKQINEEFGKNAVYAVLALDLLENMQREKEISKKDLWTKVRDRIEKELREKPAQSEQGAVKVALDLFEEKQIV